MVLDSTKTCSLTGASFKSYDNQPHHYCVLGKLCSSTMHGHGIFRKLWSSIITLSLRHWTIWIINHNMTFTKITIIYHENRPWVASMVSSCERQATTSQEKKQGADRVYFKQTHDLILCILAYNRYSDRPFGSCLYGSYDAANPRPRSNKASYNRPFATRDYRATNMLVSKVNYLSLSILLSWPYLTMH